MLCKTLHDLCEIACSSCRGSFPAPTISRSITNFGIAFSSVWCGACRCTPCRETEADAAVCIEANAPMQRSEIRGAPGTNVPGSAWLDEPAGLAETRLAGKHDGLITVLDAKLVEHPGNVVANGLLREPERRRDLRVVEALGDTFEHRTLARGQFLERQRLAA